MEQDSWVYQQEMLKYHQHSLIVGVGLPLHASSILVKPPDIPMRKPEYSQAWIQSVHAFTHLLWRAGSIAQ